MRICVCVCVRNGNIFWLYQKQGIFKARKY